MCNGYLSTGHGPFWMRSECKLRFEIINKFQDVLFGIMTTTIQTVEIT
jgi:hypothetical protein